MGALMFATRQGAGRLEADSKDWAGHDSYLPMDAALLLMRQCCENSRDGWIAISVVENDPRTLEGGSARIVTMTI